MKHFTLEEIASADYIARQKPADVDAMRHTLDSLTPETLVSEDYKHDNIRTFRRLAQDHIDSALPEIMTLDEAWYWATSDLVFHGFEVIA